jgi:hypothetical protein
VNIYQILMQQDAIQDGHLMRNNNATYSICRDRHHDNDARNRENVSVVRFRYNLAIKSDMRIE